MPVSEWRCLLRNWSDDGLTGYSPKIQKSKFRSPIAPFTVSTFVPDSLSHQVQLSQAH